MRASVIIAAHQEGTLLGKTIEACLRAACEFEHEIIVANDTSSDGSVDGVAVRFPEVQIVRHAQRLGVSPTKDHPCFPARKTAAAKGANRARSVSAVLPSQMDVFNTRFVLVGWLSAGVKAVRPPARASELLSSDWQRA